METDTKCGMKAVVTSVHIPPIHFSLLLLRYISNPHFVYLNILLEISCFVSDIDGYLFVTHQLSLLLEWKYARIQGERENEYEREKESE